MVQIGNRPMLWHIMKYYYYFGHKDFIVSCGVKSEVIKKYFYDYEINMQDYFKDFSTGQTTILNNKLV